MPGRQASTKKFAAFAGRNSAILDILYQRSTEEFTRNDLLAIAETHRDSEGAAAETIVRNLEEHQLVELSTSDATIYRYRIDLTMVDLATPGRYLFGIECDGATCHRAATARDRDKLRQMILEGLRWKLRRIWSTDWWHAQTRRWIVWSLH